MHVDIRGKGERAAALLRHIHALRIGADTRGSTRPTCGCRAPLCHSVPPVPTDIAASDFALASASTASAYWVDYSRPDPPFRCALREFFILLYAVQRVSSVAR